MTKSLQLSRTGASPQHRAGMSTISLSQEHDRCASALQTLSCYLAVSALLWPQSASATTIDPLVFEELVLGADFVGVVECEQAGGIVAAYKVIESWKGPKPGTPITIRVAVNYWEPQFPIAPLPANDTTSRRTKRLPSG